MGQKSNLSDVAALGVADTKLHILLAVMQYLRRFAREGSQHVDVGHASMCLENVVATHKFFVRQDHFENWSLE